MAFNINSFRSNGLVQGGARATQFEVNLFPPFASETSKRIKFLISSASLPGFYITPTSVPYFGATIKYNGERVYQDWNVTVMNDEDFAVRALLEKWSNSINTLISNRMSSDVWPTGYKAQAEVTQFGKDGRVLRIYQFDGLWPQAVSDIELGWGNQGQIEMFQTVFSLDYFVPVDQSSAPETYSPILSDDTSGDISGLRITPPITQ